MKFGDLFDLLKSSFQEWSNDKASRLGAALAYYTIFAIGPLLLIIISIAGFLFGSNDQAQEQVIGPIRDVVGQDGASVIEGILTSASDPGAGTFSILVGSISLLLTASGLFGQLQDALNTIWGVKPKPDAGIMVMIRERVLTFVMVIGTGVLVMASLFINVILAIIGDVVENLPIPGGSFLLQILNYVVSFGLITLVFAIIYKVLPDVNIKWRDVWIGAAVTAALFMLGQFGLALYLSFSNPGSAFGVAGALVLLLVWIYYTAQIVFFGAEFTQVYANKFGTDLQPSEHAMWVSGAERAKQGMTGQKEHKKRADKIERGEDPDAKPPRIPRFYTRPDQEPLPPAVVHTTTPNPPVRETASVVGAALIPVAAVWAAGKLLGNGDKDE